MTMEVTVHGARGSLPSPGAGMLRYGGNTACVTVDVAGEPLLIIDAGTGIAHVPAASFAGRGVNLLVSHLHWDHVIGLPFFAGARDAGARVAVYGPAGEYGFRRDLDQVISPPGFPIDTAGFAGQWSFHDVGDGTFALGSIEVTARAIRHRGLALGFRVACDGAALAYLSDHGPGAEGRGLGEDDVVPPSVVDLVQDVDLLFHDSQYADAEYQQFRTFGHTTPAYAVRVAAAGLVRTLVLFHHDPFRTDEGVDEMLAIGRRAAKELGFRGQLVAAAEGDCFVVGDPTRSSRREPT